MATLDPLATRRATLDVMEAVLRKKRPFDEAFAKSVKDLLHDAAPRDKAFTRLLCTTIFKRLNQIDNVIAQCLERPLAGRLWRVQNVLRMGAAQLLFLQTPPHAAISTAVDLAKDFGKTSGLVNAVLRRISREHNTLLHHQDAGKINMPEWLFESWVFDYGEKTAHAMADSLLHEPTLDLTVKDPDSLDHWAQELEARPLPTGTLRRHFAGAVETFAGYTDGAWWVQDAAASLPVKIMGDVQGKTVVDLCAAPGGKTMQLAAAGAEVTALDRSKNRLKILQENLKRLDLKAKVQVADGSTWEYEAPVDAVLLDAPCSATGTARRHPDILLLKKPEDVESLVKAQSKLLDHAAGMVKPGGLLIYATCSLQKVEGEAQIDAFLERHPDYQREAVKPEEIGGWAELITEQGDIRSLPCHLEADGGLDGFFASRLRRLS